jgi:hypothetical protein
MKRPDIDSLWMLHEIRGQNKEFSRNSYYVTGIGIVFLCFYVSAETYYLFIRLMRTSLLFTYYYADISLELE